MGTTKRKDTEGIKKMCDAVFLDITIRKWEKNLHKLG
jgi:hypothetical protein